MDLSRCRATPRPAARSHLAGLQWRAASWTATETSGSATSTVTVRDTAPPVLHVPANQVANATGSAGASVTFPAGEGAIDRVRCGGRRVDDGGTVRASSLGIGRRGDHDDRGVRIDDFHREGRFG